MKKKIILLCLFVIYCFAFGRESTLVDGDFDNGGYGGPYVQWSVIDGKDVVFTGGRGGWIIDHKFSIGGAGQGLVTDLEYRNAKNEKIILNMGYGGLFFQIIGNSDEVLHFNVDVLLGAGGLGLKKEIYNSNENIREDNFYIINPELDLVLNITSFFRLSFGGGYRFVYGVDIKDDTGKIHLTDKELRGPTAKVAFNFGAF